MSVWIQNHKAMLGSIAAALAAASGSVPSPYSQYLMAGAIVLAALSGGPKPAADA